MFDVVTEQLLQAAPGLPGLDPESIPQVLTEHYANLVSARLRGVPYAPRKADDEWPLERIADTYELLTSLLRDDALRRASAFVAGTAQQIVARRKTVDAVEENLQASIDQDRVDPALAAPVLFLAAEQYADASEAALLVPLRQEGQLYEAAILSENVRDFARGQLGRVLERADRWRRSGRRTGIQERALAALLETLIAGLELLAGDFLGASAPRPVAGRFGSPREAFASVLELSAVAGSGYADDLGSNVLNCYAGPHHMASLLIAACDGICDSGLISLPPPTGSDPGFWNKWLRFRADKFPFVWRNHREAIRTGFHQTGESAVVVLPTGAGKTTLSSLKIAAVLAQGKKVVFLAPTHALVEQLTVDLQEMFPKDIVGSVVSSDFDLLVQRDARLQEIEVMTPERCLAMLSFVPEVFSETGLLVFDECHLLSPQPGKLRRALDGMLCLLAFTHIAPGADLLFLSAMLKNAEEFAEWVGELTARTCVPIDLLWKPSRQARGVVIYKDDDLGSAKQAAERAQAADDERQGRAATSIRVSARRELVAPPWAIWGLHHNWLGEGTADCTFSRLLNEPVALAGSKSGRQIDLKPNANQVAVSLAVSAAKNGLKTIVFVNTKQFAVSVARDISSQLGETIEPDEVEQERWDALRDELGDLKHAVLPQPAVAVPHNSSMLRLERDLAERMFSRVNGAKVIVATPTLAQGLNLPAHLAILAGDKRADAERQGREELAAHEILNAAARAGRAGHLANGAVLLIPEPIIRFSDDRPLDWDVVEKLKSVLPKDDRCVVISDPLEILLDRVMQGEILDPDVRYMVNRMSAFCQAEDLEEPALLFDLRKSLGAFQARKRRAEVEFEAKIAELKKTITQGAPDGADSTLAALACLSGLSMELLLGLKERVAGAADALPTTVEEWLVWTVAWLRDDEDARAMLLGNVKESVLNAAGRRRDGDLVPEALDRILPGLLAWVKGDPVAAIERELGGEPDSDSPTKRVCPRARGLVGNVILRGFSFVMGLVSHVVLEEVQLAQGDVRREIVECLGTAVRRGFDTPEKVLFAGEHASILSRVQLHQQWNQKNDLTRT